jgi:hypothetical protein
MPRKHTLARNGFRALLALGPPTVEHGQAQRVPGEAQLQLGLVPP